MVALALYVLCCDWEVDVANRDTTHATLMYGPAYGDIGKKGEMVAGAGVRGGGGGSGREEGDGPLKMENEGG